MSRLWGRDEIGRETQTLKSRATVKKRKATQMKSANQPLAYIFDWRLTQSVSVIQPVRERKAGNDLMRPN